MRKAINIFTLLFFIWLVLSAIDFPSILLSFLIIGAIPGTNASVSPTVMLVVTSLSGAYIIFEILSSRVITVRRIREHLVNLATRRERLPLRRFSRVI
ncbi:MAG: hypothetical protein QG549_904 [Patescibacteria group bacterium]|nr:hypothetical protein [Patescibacteria group bacterium]